MRNIIANNYDSNLDGKLFENYVLSELLKKGFNPKYWRTKNKAEVDFIIENKNKIIPVEVKIQAEVGKIEKSLRAFIDFYKPETAIIVSLKGKKGMTKIDGCNVVYTDVFCLGKEFF